MSDIESEFAEIRDKFYPGSKRIKKSAQKKKAKGPPREENWRSRPKVYRVDGEDREFYTIGQLAEALDKKPVTIRMWINNGYMPDTRYRTPKIQGQKGKRLWTRRQIEEIQKVAREELRYHKIRDFSKTNFTERVTAVLKNAEFAQPDIHEKEKENG